MTRPRILLLGVIVHDRAKLAWSRLAAQADLVTADARDRADFLQQCRQGRYDGVRAIYRTWASAAMTGRIDDELVQALPASVGFLSHCGAGYDQVDVAACTRRGIRVSNVPGAVDDATADTALFLLLGALRGFQAGMASLRAGTWRGDPAAGGVRLGHDPRGKTLGILGCGGIGRNLARKAAALGMTVVYHNRRPAPEIPEAEAAFVAFDDLLRSSDAIAVSVPLNASTRHMLSHAQFAAMKDGVVIVNTARGAVIDEDALVAALRSGKVWSCGLDVFENEPAVHPGLLEHPRAVLLPHQGTSTVEMEEQCVGNVRSALETGRLVNVVPEQADL